MKRNDIVMVAILMVALLGLVGCGSDADAGSWEGLCGSYVWDESAQFTNSTLALMWVDQDSVLFEFDLMEGSEAEDQSMNLTVPGVLTVGDDGIGLYTAVAEDGTTAFSIKFVLSAEGQKVDVSHEGELPISPDGSYSFVDGSIEVSDALARELVGFLPGETTGLDAGDCTLQLPEGLVGDWFYPLEATHSDGEAVAAQFLVAKDLSAVFRVDTETPTLIYGSAQPMMDAEVWGEDDDLDAAIGGMETMPLDAGEVVESDEEMLDAPIPVVAVGLDGGTLISLGEQTTIEAYLPWTLPYTIEATSADPSIAAVDGQTVRAVAVGDTELTGTITIADGKKAFHIALSVVETAEAVG